MSDALGELSAAPQRLGIERHAMTVAPQRAGDQGGRDGIVLGNDDTMPKEGVVCGRTHGETLWPGNGPGVAGRVKGLTQYTPVAIGGGYAEVPSVIWRTT